MSRRRNGEGTINKSGYIVISRNRVLVYEHIEKAEKALGKKLPIGVQVHHVDGNPSNNRNSNLVICQDQGYHQLLHKRTKALNECGNANYKKCRHCHIYSDPNEMTKDGPRSFSHRECRAEYRKQRRMEGYNA